MRIDSVCLYLCSFHWPVLLLSILSASATSLDSLESSAFATGAS